MVTIDDIHAIRLKRAAVNHETYKQLFTLCCERIKRRARLPQAPLSMRFEVPPILWGRPPFDRSHARRYISDKFTRNGFRVSEPEPWTLLIDWDIKPKVRPAPSQTKRPKPRAAAPGLPPPAGSKLSARLAALRRQLG